jgi:hypothetical protein
MIINQLRTYKENSTDFELFINGEDFCIGLEDVGRPHGVKVQNETCIPEGHYKASITFSHRFQKDMILLYNTGNNTVERFGVIFTGIRVHGGSTIEHTAGCPLVRYTNGRSASHDLHNKVLDAINDGETIDWIITEKVEL